MDEAHTLLEISFEDLEASKLLLDNHHYPHALFYFQQAVEKATKSLGLFAGALTFEDLPHKIGHDTVKVFKVVIKNSENLMLPGYNDDHLDIDKTYQSILNNAKNNDIDELLPVYIKQLEEYKDAYHQNPVEVPKLKSKEELLSLISILKPALKGIPDFEKQFENQENLESLLNGLNKVLQQTPKYVERVLVLYVLCLVVIDLVTDVRYPDNANKTRPSLIYTHDHNLINNLDYLLVELKECIKVLSRIFS